MLGLSPTGPTGCLFLSTQKKNNFNNVGLRQYSPQCSPRRCELVKYKKSYNFFVITLYKKSKHYKKQKQKQLKTTTTNLDLKENKRTHKHLSICGMDILAC